MSFPHNKAFFVPSRPFHEHALHLLQVHCRKNISWKESDLTIFFSGEQKQSKSLFKGPHDQALKIKCRMRIVSDTLPKSDSCGVTEM